MNLFGGLGEKLRSDLLYKLAVIAATRSVPQVVSFYPALKTTFPGSSTITFGQSIDVVDDPPLRMKDLIRLSGLQRQTIHYYIKEGLLPPARKSATKSATYGLEHLERLQQISTLRNKQFLPIRAIRALYNNEAALALSEQQRRYLQELRLGLPESIRPGAEHYVPMAEATPEHVGPSDVQTLLELGLITAVDSAAGKLISQEDADILQAWGELRALGFSSEKGYEPDLLNLWDTALEDLVVREISFLAVGMKRDTEEESREVTRATMEVIKGLIETLHHKKTRAEFFKIHRSEIEPE